MRSGDSGTRDIAIADADDPGGMNLVAKPDDAERRVGPCGRGDSALTALVPQGPIRLRPIEQTGHGAGTTAYHLSIPEWAGSVDGGAAADAATAKWLILTCRLQTMWTCKILPVVLVAVASIVIAHIVDPVRNDAQYMEEMLLIRAHCAWRGWPVLDRHCVGCHLGAGSSSGHR